MTGTELSYRRITETIAGKLDLLEAYLFYCLALCSDCYTMVSNVKQEALTEFYGIKKEEQIRQWLHKFEGLNLIQIDKHSIKGKYGSFDTSAFRCCDSLREITLPGGVSVNERAFKETPVRIDYYEY